MARISKKRFREAVKESFGNITTIAARLSVTRPTVYNYMRKYPDFKELVDDARDSIVDVAESQLMKHVTTGNGDLRALMFVLETFGKKRGWSKRVEVTGADGDSLFGVSLDPRVMEYLQKEGMEPEQVMSFAAQQFNEMILAMAEEDSQVES